MAARPLLIMACLGLILFCTLFVPHISALPEGVTSVPKSTDPLARDSPDLISALKFHVAYVGQTQEARMDGVISYIDTISNGNGITGLELIRTDYLVTASSVPVMQTSDQISEARDELGRQSQLFAEETKAEILMFNGSFQDMRQKASKSIEAFDGSITNLRDSLWLAKDTARLTVFNKESQQRKALLSSLDKQGVDVSQAKKISDQIDAKRPDLQDAIMHGSGLTEVNSGLKAMNREFRTLVQEYQANLQIEMKRAAILAIKE